MRSKMLLGFVVLGVALAQGPGPRARRGGPQGAASQPNYDALKTYLNLTDAQVQQMQQIRQQAASSVSALLPQIRTKRQSLRDLLTSGTADPAAVGKIVLDAYALDKQVQQARTTARTQALAVLSADQQAKLEALQDAASSGPALREAMGLGLVTPPAGPGGMLGGFGMQGPRGGPGMMGGRGRMGGRGMRNPPPQQ